jgi:hypothetical protein
MDRQRTKEMIRSHIQDLAEHANLLAKRAMRPACSRGLPFAKRKIEVVRNCLVSRRGGLARGTKQQFAHRSKHRVPSATVSCAAQKELTSTDCMCIYMYCEQAKFSYGLPSDAALHVRQPAARCPNSHPVVQPGASVRRNRNHAIHHPDSAGSRG